jgi:2,3-dihydroxy-p-cumate/2,3-dihydroxybenzoate 3,4-dioxygenase
MVELEQLRYVRLVATDLGRAADFAERVLGLGPIDRTRELATFRSDFRDYTLAFVSGDRAVQSVGLEVRYPRDLEAILEGLRGLGLRVEKGSGEDCASRKVKDMAWFMDFSGNCIELVVRPLNSGWRYFPRRDAGVRGLADVILRSVDIERDLLIWTGILGARVSDWAGEAAYLRFDDAHHRIVLLPAARPGILAVEYAVEDVNLLMRNWYTLRDLQVAVVHGPGRRPASEQLFLTFAGPCDVLFSFVAEGISVDERHRARQFPAGPSGLCNWGSECKISEFNDAARVQNGRSITARTGVS